MSCFALTMAETLVSRHSAGSRAGRLRGLLDALSANVHNVLRDDAPWLLLKARAGEGGSHN